MASLADKSTKLLKLVDDLHRYVHNPRLSYEHYQLIAMDAKDAAALAADISTEIDALGGLKK